MDAANTPGLQPEVGDPMRSWSLDATKLLVKMGLRIPGDSLNTTANEMNNDATNCPGGVRGRRHARLEPLRASALHNSRRDHRQRSPVTRRAIGVLALSLALAGCGTAASTGASHAPKPVPDSGLDSLLLTVADVNAVMGTSAMKPHQVVTQMADHRNLLPNLNCLGVWQVNEGPIYDPSHWKSLRQQLFAHRTPTSGTPSSCSPSSRTARPTRRATSSWSRGTGGRSAPTTM